MWENVGTRSLFVNDQDVMQDADDNYLCVQKISREIGKNGA